MKEFGEIDVEIEGMTALLMHKCNQEDLERKPKQKIIKYDMNEQAEKHAYWKDEKEKKELCVPARCIYAMILSGAKPFRQGRLSISSVIAGAVRIEPEMVGLGTKEYEIDIRPVVIQQNRVLQARPKLNNWKLKFKIIYHREYVNSEILKKIIVDSGFRVGLLSYRPEKKGPFGTYKVTKFKEVK